MAKSMAGRAGKKIAKKAAKGIAKKVIATKLGAALLPVILLAAFIIGLTIMLSNETPANANGNPACNTATAAEYQAVTSGATNGPPNMAIATIAYTETLRRTPDPRILLAVFETGLAESEFQNYANSKVAVSLTIPHDAVGSDGTSVGYLQQQVGPNGDGGIFDWGTAAQAMDPVHATNEFLDRVIAAAPTTPGDAATLAQKVQQSGTPDGSNYRTRETTAKALIERVRATAPGTSQDRLAALLQCQQQETVAPGSELPAAPGPGTVLDSVGQNRQISVVNAGVSTMLTEGYKWLGRPYCWGGGDSNGPTKGIPTESGKGQGPEGLSPGCSKQTPGFDCSGLMIRMAATIGIPLTHRSAVQYTEGLHIPIAQARPGDMGFRSSDGTIAGIHHVFMFDADPTRIIEAPQDGVPVHVKTFRANDPQLMPYVVRLAP